MRKAALLAAGALALPLAFSPPATAAQNQNAKPPQQTGQQQPMPQSGQNNGQNNQQNSQTAQLNLNQDQVKQVQQALDQKGFKAGRQDGRIGRKTSEALTKFQKSQNLQQTGQPDDQTLQALGVNINNESTNGAATTGAAPSGQNSNMNQNQPPPANNSGNSMNNNGHK